MRAQLLGDGAGPLSDVTGQSILERSADDAEDVVAVVLIELVVLGGDNGVDEVGRELVVGDSLAILDVDLAKDLVVAIENDAGRFHPLEMAQIEGGSLLSEGSSQGQEGKQTGKEEDKAEHEREE